MSTVLYYPKGHANPQGNIPYPHPVLSKKLEYRQRFVILCTGKSPRWRLRDEVGTSHGEPNKRVPRRRSTPKQEYLSNRLLRLPKWRSPVGEETGWNGEGRRGVPRQRCIRDYSPTPRDRHSRHSALGDLHPKWEDSHSGYPDESQRVKWWESREDTERIGTWLDLTP